MARELTDAGDSSSAELHTLRGRLEDADRQLSESQSHAADLQSRLAAAEAEINKLSKVNCF